MPDTAKQLSRRLAAVAKESDPVHRIVELDAVGAVLNDLRDAALLEACQARGVGTVARALGVTDVAVYRRRDRAKARGGGS